VVSAVGHEQDAPLCDLAADVRASTPTAAAKLVVPDAGELLERLDASRAALTRCARRRVERARERLGADRERLQRAPGRGVERARHRLDTAHGRLERAPSLAVERRRAGLHGTAGRLRALSPRATLERGYAIVRTEAGILRSAAATAPGERLDVELAEGALGARVEDVRP
jgi:exodeoxyribonuclease VII large subunit